MDLSNPLYLNQGIHVVAAIFTVHEGEVKVLLVRRTNQPFQGSWMLVGGAMYNNEDMHQAMQREIFEKTQLQHLSLKQFGVFSNPNRAPQMRMLGLGFVSVVNYDKTLFANTTSKTDDAKWAKLNEIPTLGYDHNLVLTQAIAYLRQHIFERETLQELLPQEFTMPQVQKVCESILGEQIDRRNFRKQILQSGDVFPTGNLDKSSKKRPAILWQFAPKN